MPAEDTITYFNVQSAYHKHENGTAAMLDVDDDMQVIAYHGLVPGKSRTCGCLPPEPQCRPNVCGNTRICYHHGHGGHHGHSTGGGGPPQTYVQTPCLNALPQVTDDLNPTSFELKYKGEWFRPCVPTNYESLPLPKVSRCSLSLRRTRMTYPRQVTVRGTDGHHTTEAVGLKEIGFDMIPA